jgi:hypothetical protein
MAPLYRRGDLEGCAGAESDEAGPIIRPCCRHFSSLFGNHYAPGPTAFDALQDHAAIALFDVLDCRRLLPLRRFRRAERFLGEIELDELRHASSSFLCIGAR